MKKVVRYKGFTGKILFRVSLLICCVAAMCTHPVHAETRRYYSIHLASFKELQNANRFVNSLARKEKMVFWKKTDVPGKGIFYRVYLGKYADRQKAVDIWKILKEEGSVSYFGVHEFTEEVPSVRVRKPPAVKEPADKTLMEVDTREPGDRFVDNGDGTVTDRKTNLMWTKNGWRIDFFSALKWQEANIKCEQFKLAGYADWRLPTIKEWESLVDREKEYPALIEPNPFENVIVHMPYWSRTEFGSNRDVSSTTPSRAYTIMLYYGRVGHQNINKRAFVLPVRSLH